MDDHQPQHLRNQITTFVQQLASETEAAKSSESLLRYLAAVARFHDYSFHNCCLIFSQMSSATRVAGFHTWLKLGRHVKKGEHGIAILAPILMKKNKEDKRQSPVDQEPEILIRFRTVYVFDESQTEGADLPEAPVLTGADCSDDLALALTLYADEQGITIRSEKLSGSAMGVSRGGTIVISDDLVGADYFAVMAHEVAHELLQHRHHRDEIDKQAREIEAESVAYTICQHFGVPCTAPAYLALYGADSKDVIARLENITHIIQQTIVGIEANLKQFTNQASNQ